MSGKFVYLFGSGTAEGDATMKDALGGKGAGLAEMSRAGLPVPPGFTISTEVCRIFFQSGQMVPSEIRAEILAALGVLEQRTGQKLGDPTNPLLVSVRSGAAVSMPGMLDTFLNVGTLADLERARDAVFHSWFGDRAVRYRRTHGIPDDLGSAVTVQQMAPAEKSGVMFTVDPVHRRRDHMVIEAVRGLGEGIVSGLVTPDSSVVSREDGSVLEEYPAAGAQILSREELSELRLLGLRVEELFGGPQDIEWCIGSGKIFLLQSRAIR